MSDEKKPTLRVRAFEKKRRGDARWGSREKERIEFTRG
jgi:hypothetical protein